MPFVVFAQEKAPSEYKVGDDVAFDALITAAMKPDEQVLAVTMAKGLTAVLDVTAKFSVRVDTLMKRGNQPEIVFRKGVKVAVLGQRQESGDIRSWQAVVVGDGFTPQEVLPAAKAKFGDKLEWTTGAVHVFDQPITVKLGAVKPWFKIGRDDYLLSTFVRDSAVAFNPKGELRKSAAKGRPVRFRGEITAILYFDKAGKLLDKDDVRKASRYDFRVTPKWMALLDPAFDYSIVERAEE